jgi:hypothetical protein
MQQCKNAIAYQFFSDRIIGLQLASRVYELTNSEWKMTVFVDVAPCSLVDVYRRFRGIHRPDDGEESTSETSVNF